MKHCFNFIADILIISFATTSVSQLTETYNTSVENERQNATNELPTTPSQIVETETSNQPSHTKLSSTIVQTKETITDLPCNCTNYTTTHKRYPTTETIPSTKATSTKSLASMKSNSASTPAASTPAASTPATKTPAATTSAATTPAATTSAATTPAATTSAATTSAATTPAATTSAATTSAATTPAATTSAATTSAATTPASTTPASTTSAATTPASTTPASTTSASSTPAATTPASTTPAATTPASTTPASTTPASTTPASTTPAATTPAATTPASTTPASTTPASTTPASTTSAATTPASTTPASTTPASTTPAATPSAATTSAATTPASTTPASTTPAATTPAATGPAASTPAATGPAATTLIFPKSPADTNSHADESIPAGGLMDPVDIFGVDKIIFEDELADRENITGYDQHCMDVCNITTENTIGVSLVTTQATKITTTPRHRNIDLKGETVMVQLDVFIDETFTTDLKNPSSNRYKKIFNRFNNSLTTLYRSLFKDEFEGVSIHDFSSGSIRCNYSVILVAPINESQANSTLQTLRNVPWKTNSLGNFTVNVNKTTEVQGQGLYSDTLLLPGKLCTTHEVIEWGDDGKAVCKYKCDLPSNKNYCGKNGECLFTYEGDIRCKCKVGFSGKRCTKNPIPTVPTTTTAKPTKPDAIALSKIDIIGIAAGIGGGLVLILLVALCCLCTRLNKAKKRNKFYGYMDNDKEYLHDENSRIENVPDLKDEYTNLGYQTEQDELQMQRFEPEGKNVDYESGQRQGAYKRDDKAYRKVEEPEGGNVLIYQPKHLRGPMERQSGASKFDEVEESSNPYRMVDTDTTYKIRRPTVNSERNVPYN